MRKLAEIPTGFRSITSSSHITQDAFGIILNKSRLSSLPTPVSCNVSTGKALQGQPLNRRNKSKQPKTSHPTHQVITTTPASNYRHDWGLKRPLPTSRNSRFITLNKLDSETGLTDFDSGARYAMTSKRIQEMQQPVQPILPNSALDNSRPMQNHPFFTPLRLPSGSSIPSNSKTSKSIGSSKVESFKSYLKYNGYSSAVIEALLLDGSKLEAAFQRNFPGNTERTPVKQRDSGVSSDKPTDSLRLPLATAGLCYTLPGTLNNRPKVIKTPSAKLFKDTTGISSTRQDGTAVPGRLVNSNGTLANVGGITGSANLVNVDLIEIQNRQLVYDTVQPFTIQSIGITRQGSIDLVVRALSPHTSVHRTRREGQRKGTLLSKKKKDDDLLGLVNQSI